jgi:hypothetical protein
LETSGSPFRVVQLWVTVFVLGLAPMVLGSVGLFWIAIWTVLLSVGVLCGLTTPLTAVQSRVLLCFLSLALVYAVVCVVQFAPDLNLRWTDPNWSKLNELLALDAPARIAIRAEMPAFAIGHFLLFTTAFINGFGVGTSRRLAELLVRSAQYTILIYASYGLISLVATPDMILWIPKRAYQGDLTATFVNRNTAATFVGAGAILWFHDGLAALLSLRASSIRLLLLSGANGRLAVRFVIRLSASLVCFTALLATGSRAGLACTCAGLFVACLLTLLKRARCSSWLLITLASGASISMAALFSRLGRIGSSGLFDEGRWSVYLLSIGAIGDRPFFGSGAGTFADLFPSLRTPDFYSWGLWDRAHSSIMEIAVEMGIPMTFLIIAASVLSLWLLIRAATAYEGSSRDIPAAVASVAILSYLHAMVDFSLQIPGYLIMFGALLGCGLAGTCLIPRKSERGCSSRHSLGSSMGGRNGSPKLHPEEVRTSGLLSANRLPVSHTHAMSRHG